MNDNLARFSTSENALEKALAYATEKIWTETKCYGN
jgi:hypothetical protein